MNPHHCQCCSEWPLKVRILQNILDNFASRCGFDGHLIIINTFFCLLTMSDNTEKKARIRHTARKSTASYTGNLPNHRETQGMVSSRESQGVIQAKQDDSDSVEVPVKRNRPQAMTAAAKREAYNAKRRVPEDQRKNTGISFAPANPKTGNKEYYSVSWKRTRTRFDTKEEANSALQRYKDGECSHCGMNKPKMIPAQKKPPADSDPKQPSDLSEDESIDTTVPTRPTGPPIEVQARRPKQPIATFKAWDHDVLGVNVNALYSLIRGSFTLGELPDGSTSPAPG
jgi:hypothetical protein